MIATPAYRPARRNSHTAKHLPHPAFRGGMGTRLLHIAASGPAKMAYIAIGTVGLAALAVAVLGPKRIEREVLRPLKGAVTIPAEKLWDQAKPLRDQIAGFFDRAGPSRERLAHRLQSWVGHFRAT